MFRRLISRFRARWHNRADASEFPANPPAPPPQEAPYTLYCVSDFGTVKLFKSPDFWRVVGRQAEYTAQEMHSAAAYEAAQDLPPMLIDPYSITLCKGSARISLVIVGGTDGGMLQPDRQVEWRKVN